MTPNVPRDLAAGCKLNPDPATQAESTPTTQGNPPTPARPGSPTAGRRGGEPVARTWVKLTIAEPFPVLYGHVDVKDTQGPFYAAGSTWYNLPVNRPFVDWQAAELRKHGYTVTVSEEARQ